MFCPLKGHLGFTWAYIALVATTSAQHSKHRLFQDSLDIVTPTQITKKEEDIPTS